MYTALVTSQSLKSDVTHCFFKHSTYSYGEVRKFIEVDIDSHPCLLVVISVVALL